MTAGFSVLSQRFSGFALFVLSSSYLHGNAVFATQIGHEMDMKFAPSAFLGPPGRSCCPLESLFLRQADEIKDEIADGSRTIHADTPAPQIFLFILQFPLDFTLLLAYNKHVNKRGAQPRRKEK
nr:MAG TPA: hypothetical protein [Caudoviricetes sp.]